MVNIPDDLLPAIEARAAAERRPLANYLEWLAACDIAAWQAQAVHEKPAPYITPSPAGKKKAHKHSGSASPLSGDAAG